MEQESTTTPETQEETQTGVSEGDTGQGFVTLEQLESFKGQMFADMRKTIKAMSDQIVSKVNEPAHEPDKASKNSKNAEEPTPAWAQKILDKMGEYDADMGRRKFESSIDGKGYSKGQADALYKLYEKDAPDDIDEWLGGYKDIFQPHAKREEAPAKERSERRPQRVGAPASLSDLDRANVHPNDLTAEQVRLMGPEKLEKYVKQWFRKNG